MRTKYKAWAKPFIEEHKEICFDLETDSFPESFNLELGSGKGKFLLEMSLKFPNMYFIGVEKNVTCAGITAKKLYETPLNNAKLIFADASFVLSKLKDSSVENIFLNFSDPWPKKRHHKRRLTADSFLDEYYRVLKKGGQLIIKTDNDDLFEFTKENLTSKKFSQIKLTDNYDGLDPFDIPTEYELSFRSEGKSIHRIVLMK